MKYDSRSVKVEICISAHCSKERGLVEQTRSRHRAECIASWLGAPGDACPGGLTAPTRSSIKRQETVLSLVKSGLVLYHLGALN